jgi:hypothetical protein
MFQRVCFPACSATNNTNTTANTNTNNTNSHGGSRVPSRRAAVCQRGGGASAYLAIMALAHVAQSMRPLALALNLLVSAV